MMQIREGQIWISSYQKYKFPVPFCVTRVMGSTCNCITYDGKMSTKYTEDLESKYYTLLAEKENWRKAVNSPIMKRNMKRRGL